MRAHPEWNDTKKILLKDVLPPFLLTRLLIAGTGLLSSWIIIKDKWYGRPGNLMNLFYRWDSLWYMDIVTRGYVHTPGKQSNVVFFPLYPLLVKAFSAVIGHPRLTGFLISNVALLIALVYLVKLIRIDDQDPDLPGRAVLYALIFPAGLYFSMFYSEGLFLCLAITSFYYARRKRWLIASLLGFFLSLTRSIGVLILVPLVAEYLDLDFSRFRIDFKKIRPNVLWLLLVPAGLLSYMTFLYLKFGDFLLFAKAHALWNRKMDTIWATVMTVKKFTPFYQYLFAGTVVLMLAFVAYCFVARMRSSYTLYGLANVLVFLSSGLVESFPRYLAVVFPLYLAMAFFTGKNKFLETAWTLFSVTFLVLFTVLFVNGYWMT